MSNFNDDFKLTLNNIRLWNPWTVKIDVKTTPRNETLL